ncbi:cytochrome P450 family protein [Ceratobasidium sp. AG-Ba]|nr:cytochrome P450 family protein [Ceratobasidium sp. AG-Ba]
MDILLSITRSEIFTYTAIGYLLAAVIGLKLARLSYNYARALLSPLRHLNHPKNGSILFGNMKQVFAAPGATLHEDWISRHGSTFAYRAFLSKWRLFTIDPRALTFIMAQAYSFPKPENFRRNLANLLGDGILFAEFDAHKRQRRIMNPAFGPPQVRELVPIFWEKSNKLKDIWLSLVKSGPENTTVIDVLPWLSRATLDIIGAAGFDYHFNALDGEENELAEAFGKIFEAGPELSVLVLLKTFFPVLKIIPDQRSRMLDHNMTKRKKAALAQELKTGTTAQSRDLLTLLIKANMAAESEDQRMSDEEVLGQISTFLTAGHETTSTSTTWALYALSKHPEVQHKLRKELLESNLGDEPSMADLDKLPYLNDVIREVLRLHAPVSGTVREADHDIQIPVSKRFKDRYGVERDHIELQKGDSVFIPILAMNRNRDIWGDDAADFRPERWENPAEAVKGMPGVWGHLMTFSVIEMKALLYSLIRAIEFGIDPNIEIEGKTGIVTRPRVVSEPEKGNQMPLICKPVHSV